MKNTNTVGAIKKREKEEKKKKNSSTIYINGGESPPKVLHDTGHKVIHNS